MGCVWVYMKKMELRNWLEYGDENTRINQLNEKRSLIPWIKSANLDHKFLFKSFAAFRAA